MYFLRRGLGAGGGAELGVGALHLCQGQLEGYFQGQEPPEGMERPEGMEPPKGFDPGSVAPMAAPGSKSQFVVYYFAGYRDGRQLWEVDKRNQKFVIDGKDYWAEVRKALGE